MANIEQTSDIKKIRDLMKDIKFAMLTTMEEDGALRSRPMTTQDIEFDGDIWFFTGIHSAKTWEAGHHRQVNVSFADSDKSKFVSASGTAELIRDRAKLEELWKPAYKVFFPRGLEDPELALMKITVDKAEYWDSAPTAIGRAINFAKAFVTKDPAALGTHAKVELK